MRTLAFVALTASAALAVPAAAQDAPGASAAPAPAAAAAMASSAAGGMDMGGSHMGGGMHMQPAGHSWHGPPPGMHMPPPMMHGGRHFQFQHIQRGGFVPPFFWGGGFQVGNWGLYGFPPPGDGGRWIRYYDDALLIDRSGRVVDGRYGWDWDRYGEDWDYDGQAPAYRGHGRDYAADGRYYRAPPPGYDGPPPGYDGPPPPGVDGPPRGYDGPPPPAYQGGPPPGAMCGNPCTHTYVMHGPAGPPPAYGHGGYYGGYSGAYGCGCGPVLVSETIVTTPPVVETHTYTTYVTEWVKARPRRVYHRPPPPPPGERG